MGDQDRDPLRRRGFLRLRERFLRRGKQPGYIAECGFAPATVRRYGDAPKGQRVNGLVSGHRRPRPARIAARMDGRRAAPCLFEDTCDPAVFNTWRQRRIGPRLNAHPLVIMANAAFHKSPETAQLIEHTDLFARPEPH
ncbi:MAG: transposase [Nitrospira sp.]